MGTLLAPLIQPMNLFLAMIVVAAVLALLRWRRLALSAAAAGAAWLLAWSLPVTSLWLGGALEQRYPYVDAAQAPTADAIVVLGGNTANNRDNWFLDHDPATARSRVARAEALYRAGRAPRILLSGGALEGDVSEAQGMAHYLRQDGVPDSALILENDSRNTYENALLSDEKLAEHQISSVLLVTSALHMPRSMAAFAKQTQTHAIAAPVAPQIWLPKDGSVSRWLPDERTLDASRSIIKEYIGLMVYWLRGWV